MTWRFAIDNTGQVTVANGVLLDFEQNAVSPRNKPRKSTERFAHLYRPYEAEWICHAPCSHQRLVKIARGESPKLDVRNLREVKCLRAASTPERSVRRMSDRSLHVSTDSER